MSNDDLATEAAAPDTPPAPEPAEIERAAPITSRFLFVDVAAQRAKQLRRGAQPRIDEIPEAPFKLERVAMREVREGLILYTLPPLKAAERAESGSA
jgi:DNA-directed RNA polymerase omega subunit